MKASVLFPTYNRADILPRVLEAYAVEHAGFPEFELVVVDDGSADGTCELLRAFAAQHPAWVKLALLDGNVGPARARNAALPLTSHELVLITGDDILPRRGLVRRHVEWHARHPAPEDALLGRVTWPSELQPTDFMRWLETAGSMFYFDYRALPADRPVGGRYFYTCQVSLKRELLFRTALFDVSFRYASHEDLELGHRLEQAGMRLWFDASFEAHHWHRLTFADVVRRIYTMGYSAETYWAKVPDRSGPLRRAVKRVARALAATPPARAALRRLLQGGGERRGHLYWRGLLTLAYWVGLADAARGAPRMPFPAARDRIA